jgi:tryptophan halogenase
MRNRKEVDMKNNAETAQDNLIKHVVILGGGTAGWMTASYLSKVFEGGLRITLVEAESIPKIGVGEASIPNLQRAFFDYLGVPEEEWMRACRASFKIAVKFVNWQAPAQNGHEDHFYHPFGLLPSCDNVPLSHYWLLRRRAGDDEPYDYACFKEPPIMDAKLSPRYLDGRRVTNYAWHFDANLVAEYLKSFSVAKQGVNHIIDEFESIVCDANGFITALKTKGGITIEGDLFIDCSGFRGLLINKSLGEPFLDMGDHLFCDSAVAAALPHDDEKHGIEPFTSAIAMSSGWTWKIPLLRRFGTGYVYSSRFATIDEAVRDFCTLWNLDPDTTPLNKIKFRVGRNRRAWVKNCVSIGLASCFLDPLESTGIYFIYAALFQLAKHFPDKRFDPVLIERFNKEIETMFDDCRDFIQAHYVVAPRMDTPFWRATKQELTLSDNIKEKIETYKAGLPVNMPISEEKAYYGNFEAEFRNFWTNGSYYCIFGGLGLIPEVPMPALLYKKLSQVKAGPMFVEVKRQQRELVRTLPTTYQYLQQLHGLCGQLNRHATSRTRLESAHSTEQMSYTGVK